MKQRINAGYTITDSVTIGKTEFVIGRNNAQPPMFVTWACKGGNDYFWGHYMETREAAERDLLDRAAIELELQYPSRETKQRDKERER